MASGAPSGPSANKRIDPEDRDDFVSNIGARDRRITEWLNDAIYDTLPSRIRTFMLDTCILNEFSAPLCDTVRSTDDSGDTSFGLRIVG